MVFLCIVFLLAPWTFFIVLVIFSRTCDDVAYSKHRPQGLCTSSNCIRCNRNKQVCFLKFILWLKFKIQEFKQGVENFNNSFRNNPLCSRLRSNLECLNNDQDGLFLKLNFVRSIPLWDRTIFTSEICRDLELLNGAKNIISLECNTVSVFLM